MDRSGERPIPMLAGVALIGAGALFLGYALFQYVSIANDPSYSGVGWRDTYEMRDTARGMLLGVALVTLGIMVVALRLRDRLRAPRAPREAEKDAAAAPAPRPAAAPTRPDPRPVPAPAPKAAPSPKRPDGGISLHSRCVEFTHPVSHETIRVTAPVPAGDRLWAFFEESQR